MGDVDGGAIVPLPSSSRRARASWYTRLMHSVDVKLDIEPEVKFDI